MAVQQIGPFFYINGPLPRAPRYGLVESAEINPETDEHWGNGIQVHGYIPDTASGWGVCPADVASPADTKSKQSEGNPLPEFGPLTVYLAETCSTRTMEPTQAAFKARAAVTFAAVESAAVAREFETGETLPDNPYLGDTNMVALNLGNPTSLQNGLALLEEAIAETGRAGVIHMTKGTAAALSAKDGGNALHVEQGKLYTINGTLVIADAGYTGQAPDGLTANGTERWAFATGPVEILRSEPFIMPPDVAQAVDRSINEITYRAERYYIAYWDTALQVGVRMDRCLDACSD